MTGAISQDWESCQIGGEELALVWPLRRRGIARREVSGVRLITKPYLRGELGFAMRIGVGGLWGGFGRAWTRRGIMELWVSREEWVVLVERQEGKSLLLTLARPEEFVAALAPHAAVPGAAARPIVEAG